MFYIGNGIHSINGSCTGTQKTILIHPRLLYVKKYSKRDLTSLFCTKCNDINIHYSCVQCIHVTIKNGINSINT